MNGYFAYSSSCIPCNNVTTGCLACTYNDLNNGTLTYNSSFYACTSCNSSANYVINGGVCTLCNISNCQICANLTVCSTCLTGYNLSDASTCVICNITGCQYCSATNSSQCGLCNTTQGYYINSTFGCITQCGDGIFVAGVEQCDNITANTADLPSSNDSTKLLLIILLPLLLALCCCCLIIFLIWRRRKN